MSLPVKSDISPLTLDYVNEKYEKAYKDHCRQYTYEMLNLFTAYAIIAFAFVIFKNIYFLNFFGLFRTISLVILTVFLISIIKKYGSHNKLILDVGFCFLVLLFYVVHIKFFFPAILITLKGKYFIYLAAALETFRVFLFIGKIKWSLVCGTNLLLNFFQYSFIQSGQETQKISDWFLLIFSLILMNTLPVIAYFQERSFKMLFLQYCAFDKNLKCFEELIKAMPHHIIILDAKKEKILFVNEEVKKFYNNENEKSIFQKIKLIQVGTTNILSLLPESDTNKEFFSFLDFQTNVIYPKTNEENYFDVKMGRISWQNEPAFLISMNDISAIKMVKKLKELDSYKDRLLATVSHDLRTPLNGIIGIMEIMLTKISEKELRKLIKISLRSANLLLFMINDILDFSQISNGKLRLVFSKHRIMEFVSEIITLFKFQCQQKNIELILEVSKELTNQVLNCDPRRLQQVLLNLISNAVKFTSEGHIKLKVSKIFENSQRFMEFEVSDTGMGIKSADFSKLFQLFGKLEQDNSSINQTGVGLGLVICKRLVELLSGDPNAKIYVRSQYQKGCSFSFRLPIDIAEEDETNEEIFDDEKQIIDNWRHYNSRVTQPSLGSGNDSTENWGRVINLTKILLVDDDQINLFVIGKYLESFGIKYQTAWNGKIAIEILERQNDFNLIFMDCNMPIMNGFEAAKKIKELEIHNVIKNIPILALTANTTQMDIEQCMKNGMSGFLGKPVSRQQMKEKLQDLLRVEIQEATLEKWGSKKFLHC